jgi:hypothetical protein
MAIATPIASIAGDPASAFLATVKAPLFRARSTVSGTVHLHGKVAKVAGTYLIKTTSYASAVTIGSSRAPEIRVTYNGTWVRKSSGRGPWYAGSILIPAADLRGALQSTTGMTDVGIESRSGVPLHHLVSPPGPTLSPAALGLTEAQVRGMTGHLEAWVDDNGSPAAVLAATTWSGVGDVDEAGSLSLTFTISDVNGTVIIEEPASVWLPPVASKRYRYAMAKPEDWWLYPGTGKHGDTFEYSLGSKWVVVYSRSAQGAPLPDWIRGFTYFYRHQKGYRAFALSSSRSTVLDGVRGRRLDYTGRVGSSKEWASRVIVIHGHLVYDVAYISSQPLTAEDRSTFDTYLSTFEFR